MPHRCSARLALLLCLALPTDARAVRPFITDDARVVGKYLAQLETWVRVDRASFQHWVLVAVGPGAPLELTVGAVHGATYGDAAPAYSAAGPLVQAKLLLWDPRPNRWPGLAISGGILLPTGTGAFGPDSWDRFVYAALTESLLREDRLLVHGNVGAFLPGSEGGLGHEPSLTWGLGAQLRTFAGMHLVAEVFSGDPYAAVTGGAFQAGLRYIVNAEIQIDATTGVGLWGGPALPAWGTAGIRLVTPPRWLTRPSPR